MWCFPRIYSMAHIVLMVMVNLGYRLIRDPKGPPKGPATQIVMRLCGLYLPDIEALNTRHPSTAPGTVRNSTSRPILYNPLKGARYFPKSPKSVQVTGGCPSAHLSRPRRNPRPSWSRDFREPTLPAKAPAAPRIHAALVLEPSFVNNWQLNASAETQADTGKAGGV